MHRPYASKVARANSKQQRRLLYFWLALCAAVGALVTDHWLIRETRGSPPLSRTETRPSPTWSRLGFKPSDVPRASRIGGFGLSATGHRRQLERAHDAASESRASAPSPQTRAGESAGAANRSKRRVVTKSLRAWLQPGLCE